MRCEIESENWDYAQSEFFICLRQFIALSEGSFSTEDSKTVLFAYHANDPNIGMALHRDTSKFKMFCADTGLFITLAFWDKSFTENVIYEKLLSDKLSDNLGYVYENLVATSLYDTFLAIKTNFFLLSRLFFDYLSYLCHTIEAELQL